MLCSYEPVQPVSGAIPGLSLIQLHPSYIDFDVLQRLQHGTVVIRYDLEQQRSGLCKLHLDSSCGALIWEKIAVSLNKGAQKVPEL